MIKRWMIGCLFLVLATVLLAQKTVTLNFDDPTMLLVNAGDNVAINIGDSIALGGNPSASRSTGTFSFEWTPEYGLSSSNAANPNVSPSETTMYFLKVSDSGNCSSIDSILVTVNSSSHVSEISGKNA